MDTAQPLPAEHDRPLLDAALHDLADRMIRLSAVRPEDRVTLVGRHKLPLLLDLYRRGFTEAGCESGLLTAPHEPASSLWILRVENEGSLDRLLGGLGPALRPGGSVVVWCKHPAPDDLTALRVQTIRRLFAERGLIPLIQATDGGSGYLLSAHKPADKALARRGAA